jgi:MFS family permease
MPASFHPMSTDIARLEASQERRTWYRLVVVCFGVLMIGINSTIVHVALPSIKLELGFTDTSVPWVVNAYLVSFGGFLLLGGRLGDMYGPRRVFLHGVMLFTLASLGCAFTTSASWLIATRFVQGLGGAIVAAVALSLTVSMFTDPPKRARALGVRTLCGASGGSVGVLLGGVLTGALGWRWIFVVNVVVGATVYALCHSLLPRGESRLAGSRLDIAGAVTATASVILASCAIVNGRQWGWNSAHTLGVLASAALLIVLFVSIEKRAPAPLVPLSLFANGDLITVNVAGSLLTAALLGWNVVSALHMQLALGLTPLQVGLMFLPANLAITLVSLVVAPALVARWGTKPPMVTGMLVATVGLTVLASAPLDGNVLINVLPGMIVVALGSGMANGPLLMRAVGGVSPSYSGTAAGLMNTSLAMGGALGLSILINVATAWSGGFTQTGSASPSALGDGYRLAYGVAAIFAATGAVISVIFLGRNPSRTQ